MKRTISWSTAKGSSVLNKDKDRIVRLAINGSTMTSIAIEFGVVTSHVINKLREWGVYDRKIKCGLVECDIKFEFKPGKICCCRKHIKRLNHRDIKDNIFVSCKLPECDERVLKAKKMFCCRSHSEAHSKRKRTGFYDRLRNKSPACFVCGEWRTVDEHHIRHHKGKSDKEGPVAWICPTHHLAIHRRLAYIDEKTMIYHWLDQKILDNLDD